MFCHWRVLCTERTCNSSIAIWTRICFCSAVKMWGTHRRCRTMKRRDCVRCRCRCMVDLGRQILRESSCTDENGNGNSARGVGIASLTKLRSISGASGGVASFGPENGALRVYLVTVEYATASFPARLKDCCRWHQEPSLSSGDRGLFNVIFPEKGTGKRL
jgi:hypothetical protein